MKSLMDAILYFLTFILVLFCMGNAWGAGLVSPSERHFIAKPKWLSFNTPETFIVETSAFNTSRVPIKVRPIVNRVELVNGEIRVKEERFQVKPDSAFVFPDQVAKFQILFPWKSGESFLCIFMLTPEVEQREKAITINSVTSHLFGVTFLAKGQNYEFRPILKTRAESGRRFLVIGNPGKTLAEVNVKTEDGETLNHLFVPAGGSNETEIRVNLDSIVLDVSGLSRSYGFRLPR